MTEPFATSDQNFETAKPGDGRHVVQDSPWLKYALTEANLNQHKKTDRDHSSSPTDLIIDAGHSLAYQGGQAWITSLGQIADDVAGSGTRVTDFVSVLPRPEEAEYRSNRWYAQQLGGGIGFFAPFAITHAGLKATGLSVAARTEQTIASTGRLFSAANGIRLIDGAVTGFVADFALRPLEGSELGENHLIARAKNGLTGAAVMTTMTAGSLAIRQASRSLAAGLVGEGAAKQTGRILYDGGVGVLSGIPGGAASAQAHSLIHEGRLATDDELGKAIYTSAWTGGVLSAGHVIGRDPGVTGFKPSETDSGLSRYRYNKRETFMEKTLGKISDYHSQARWAIRDGVTETRATAYSVLNKFDMRHPIQRLSNAFRTPEPAAPRVPLTETNNPIKAFERELPRFIKEIEAKEQIMNDTKDRAASHEIWKEMGTVRADFAVKLLEMWHGTPEAPGIKSMTDAELATAGIPIERVAEIRSAFDKPAKGEHYRGPSELTEALLKLYGKEVDASTDHIDILGEIEIAKQRFYGYNVNDLNKRMQMPRQHAIKDHEGDTPVDWMPNVREPGVADLYHGTMSGSLSSILVERKLLPPGELRLRGIKQTTGESANENLHRQNISITRDFTEAYAYHRHSPAYLTGFPVVFGISREIAPRTRLAGMLERGELLVPQLRVGDNLGTMLGLRSKDISMIFAPDAEVKSLEQQLRENRIRGVNVVGFNQMKTPQWITEAPPQYDEFGFKIKPEEK
jgi:hypothetical protein